MEFDASVCKKMFLEADTPGNPSIRAALARYDNSKKQAMTGMRVFATKGEPYGALVQRAVQGRKSCLIQRL
ncbi:hypothetical protein ACU81Q_05005 [Komagataeibacter melomenusus]